MEKYPKIISSRRVPLAKYLIIRRLMKRIPDEYYFDYYPKPYRKYVVPEFETERITVRVSREFLETVKLIKELIHKEKPEFVAKLEGAGGEKKEAEEETEVTIENIEELIGTYIESATISPELDLKDLLNTLFTNPSKVYSLLSSEEIEYIAGRPRVGIFKETLNYYVYEFREVLGNMPTAYVVVRKDPLTGYWIYVVFDLMRLEGKEIEVYNLVREIIEDLPTFSRTITEVYQKAITDKEKALALSVKSMFDEILDQVDLGIRKYSRLYYKILVNLLREYVGFRQLNILFSDKEHLEELSFTAVGRPIKVIHRGVGDWCAVYEATTNRNINFVINTLINSEYVNYHYLNLRAVTFHTLDEADSYIRFLAQRSGKYVSYSSPRLAAQLPDGSRLQANYSTIITPPEFGPSIAVRFKSESVVLPLDLIIWGTASPTIMAFEWMVLEVKDIASLLIAGETSSGKTTTLQALLYFVPNTKKVLTIEDTPELKLPHEHWLAKRVPNMESTEEDYDQYVRRMYMSLVKDALRERPDYLIIQEVRGEEARPMFQGITTGHPAMSTIHARDFESVKLRLTSPPINVPKNMVGQLRQVLVMFRFENSNKRVIRWVYEVDTDESGDAVGVILFRYDLFEDAHLPTRELMERIMNRKGIFKTIMERFRMTSPSDLLREWATRTIYLDALARMYYYYKNRNLIDYSRLTPAQRDALQQIFVFWDSLIQSVGGDISRAFFSLVEGYRMGITTRHVLTLASRVLSVLEIEEVVSSGQ